MASLRVLLAGSVLAFPQIAFSQAEKAPPVVSNPVSGVLKEALQSYRDGAFDLAVAKYNEVLKTSPQSAEAFAGITRSYLRQDKVREATDTLKRALELQPSNPELKVVQGELFFRQGKMVEAEKLFVESVNSGQNNPRAYLGIARISAAIAMYAREYKFITYAHDLDPTDPEIQKRWMSTLSRDERIKFLESYLAQPNADDADTRRHLREYLDFLRTRQAKPRRACRLVSDLSATETNLLPLLVDANHLRGYGLPVMVNGKKAKLLLDTGAGGITINRKLATRAGVERVSNVHIGGVGDKADADAYIGYADSIRIGDLEFHNCPVAVIEQRSVAEEEGLIGADVFENFLIEIDFPGSKLRLSPLPPHPGEPSTKAALVTDEDEDGDKGSEAAPNPSGESPTAASKPPAGPRPRYFDRYIAPEMQSYAGVYRFGHMLLVPTKINDVPEKLFLIDSGAFNNMITPEAAREVTKVHGLDDFSVRGLKGQVKKVYETDEVVLEFGHLRQKMLDMVAFDLSRISRSTGTEISGTLGFAMLNLLKLKLDYRDSLVDFEYKDPRKR